MDCDKTADETGGALPPGTRRARRAAEAEPAARARGHAHVRRGLDDSTRMRLKGLLALVMVGAMSSSMVVLRDGAAQADLRTSAAAGGPALAPAAAAPAAPATTSLVHPAAPATSAPSATRTRSTSRRASGATPRERKVGSGVTASASPRTSRSSGSSPSLSSSGGSSRSAPGVQGSLPFATNCSVSPILVPSCGAYWGIYSRRFGNHDVATSVTTWESMLGRRFDIVLMYYDFSNRIGPGRFPDRQMTQLSQDRIPLYDWETRDYVKGTNLRWADVAAGKYDASVVIPQAQRLKAYGKPVMLGIDHEMDISYPQHGSPAEYRAMYRHIHDVFAAQGVGNVVWVWTVTGWIGNRSDLVKSFYPGNDLVDWIGYDPYNFNKCHGNGWRTFEETISGFYRWSDANGLGSKPLLLQEYGLTPDLANVAASQQWYRDIPSVLKRYPRLKALVRWDSDISNCTLRIDAGQGMREAFKQAGLAIPRP